MISVVITAFKEPKTIGQAIEALQKQDVKEPFEIIVCAPDKETQDVAKTYKNVKIFNDPGKGKTLALNLLFKELKGDVWVFTDGDVHVSENALSELMKVFRNPKVGCVTGRPVSSNPKTSMVEYWSHLLADAGAHNVRKEKFLNNEFLESSGYLFAFRNNGVIKEIPLDIPEDIMISYIFWKKGFKLGYAENAKVYVKNPDNFKDWLNQRKRTASGHENMADDIPDVPKVKNFTNEAKKGFIWALQYPQNTKEFIWTLGLFAARTYMWLSIYYDRRIRRKFYGDAWDRVESTK